MKTKTNIELSLYEIVWNSGKVEQYVWNAQQLAGFKRRKGIKKQFITLKKIATISVQIKSAI